MVYLHIETWCTVHTKIGWEVVDRIHLFSIGPSDGECLVIAENLTGSQLSLCSLEIEYYEAIYQSKYLSFSQTSVSRLCYSIGEIYPLGCHVSKLCLLLTKDVHSLPIQSESGCRRRYSDSLRDWQSGNRIPVEARPAFEHTQPPILRVPGHSKS